MHNTSQDIRTSRFCLQLASCNDTLDPGTGDNFTSKWAFAGRQQRKSFRRVQVLFKKSVSCSHRDRSALPYIALALYNACMTINEHSCHYLEPRRIFTPGNVRRRMWTNICLVSAKLTIHFCSINWTLLHCRYTHPLTVARQATACSKTTCDSV